MRRGFTLIELSVVICIFFIVFSFSIIGIKSYKNYMDEVGYSEDLYNVKDFLSRVKGKSININKALDICIEKKEGIYKVKLVDGGECIEELKLNGQWDYIRCNRIGVNEFGCVKPYTIEMKKGIDKYKITIQVGGDLINVRKE